MTTKTDYVALQAELDEDWEQTADFQPLGQQLPIPREAVFAFWTWYDAHQNNVILRKRLLVFLLTVQVRHLRRLFTSVFGPHP